MVLVVLFSKYRVEDVWKDSYNQVIKPARAVAAQLFCLSECAKVGNILKMSLKKSYGTTPKNKVIKSILKKCSDLLVQI